MNDVNDVNDANDVNDVNVHQNYDVMNYNDLIYHEIYHVIYVNVNVNVFDYYVCVYVLNLVVIFDDLMIYLYDEMNDVYYDYHVGVNVYYDVLIQ